MTTSFRGFGIFIVCSWVSACGSSSSSTSTQSAAGSGGDATQSQAQPENEQARQGAMGLANSVREEFVRLKSEHEAAWQERIRIATGPDLDTIGPRYATVSADFTTRADQAWQAMNTAVGHVQGDQFEQFRQYINQSRAHVAVLRQMVEQIQGELMQLQGAAPPTPAPAPRQEP